MSFKMRLEWSPIFGLWRYTADLCSTTKSMRMFHAFQQFDSLYTTKSQDQHSPTNNMSYVFEVPENNCTYKTS